MSLADCAREHAHTSFQVPSHVPDFFRWEGSAPTTEPGRSVLLPAFPDTPEQPAATDNLQKHISREPPDYYAWVSRWELLHFHTATTVTVRTPPPS